MPPQSNTGQPWCRRFWVERTMKYSSTASGAAPRPLKRAYTPSASPQAASVAASNVLIGTSRPRRVGSVANCIRGCASKRTRSVGGDAVLRGIERGRRGLHGLVSESEHPLHLVILDIAR